MLLFVFLAALAPAQPPDDQNFFDVTFGIVGTAARGPFRLVFDDRLQGRVEVTPSRGGSGEITWFPKQDTLQLAGRIDQRRYGELIALGEGDSRAITKSEESYTASLQTLSNIVNTMITVRPVEKTYDLQFMIAVDMSGAMRAVEYNMSSRTEGAPSLGGGKSSRAKDIVPLDMGPSQWSVPAGYFMLPMVTAKNLKLEKATGPVIGRTRVPLPQPSGWDGEWNLAIDASWRIGTALPPVELEVTIPEYAQWRPAGSLTDPAKPGNSLMARATLKPKGGPSQLMPEAKEIRFELTQTSSEPGVCMNWPLGADDRALDLRLARAPNVQEGKLGEKDQSYVVPDPARDENGRQFAEVQLDSYDFGGRSILRVVAILEDGTELEGVLKGEGAEMTKVRLPKRDELGWIAESWRKDKNVAKTPDDDDGEKVDGQPHNGDGYTLYEEYRGWREAGKHIEGDPAKKDFFVLNERGADTRAGIALFQRLSQLKVHAKLIENVEMSEEERCMNRNRRETPHIVDQHGVVILGGNGFPGGVTVGVEKAPAGYGFRPKNVRWIMFEASEAGRGLSAFSIQKGLGAGLGQRDAELAWDRAVAHELLHSVGVEHHGEGLRMGIPLYFQSRNSPINPTGKDRLVHEGGAPSWEWYVPNSTRWGAAPFSADRGPTVTVLWEDTLKPIFEEVIPVYEDWLQKTRLGYTAENMAEPARQLAYTGKSAAFWAELCAAEGATTVAGQSMPSLYVSDEQSTDSGHELCVMRYYFANGYRKKGEKYFFYMLRPGTNRAGRDICRNPDGTGGNAPSHSPQSRFGAAAKDRGNCFSQICPNDNVPPRRSN